MQEQESLQQILEKANAGDAEAQNAMGRLVISRGGAAAAEAEAWFRRAAEQGLAKAKHNLGVLYLREGGARWEALTWFEEAANDGWLPSIFTLGAIYRDEGKIERAKQLFETAAQRGHAESQDALARIYFDRETEQDYICARHWSELAAGQAVVAAQTRLGTIFHEGLGTPRDPQRALACFLAAARQGHSGAQLMVGGAYDVGVGVASDKVEAAQWLMRSAEQGNEMARAYLQTLAKELQKHELEEAQRRSRQPLS